MGDENKGCREVALQPLQKSLHLAAQLGVEGRKRLVQQHELRLTDDGTCQGDPLALPP